MRQLFLIIMKIPTLVRSHRNIETALLSPTITNQTGSDLSWDVPRVTFRRQFCLELAHGLVITCYGGPIFLITHTPTSTVNSNYRCS